MFENKNDPSSKNKSDATSNLHFTDKASSSVGKAAVHTMKEDLKKIEKGEPLDENYEREASHNFEGKSAIKKEEVASPLSKSPFLTDEAPSKQDATGSLFSKKSFVENKNFENKEPDKKQLYISEKAPGGKVWTNLVFISVTIFILLLLGMGTYYYLINYQESSASQAIMRLFEKVFSEKNIFVRDVPEENTSENIPEGEIPPAQDATYSTSNPNYLSVAEENLDGQNIKFLLEEQARKLLAQGQSSPISFLLTDSMNNPVGFRKFSEIMQINFSSNIMSSLSDDFELFVYIDNGKPATALSIKSLDDGSLRIAFSSEEESLVSRMSPLFLTSTYSTPSTKFSSSFYGDAEIRFLNILSPEELSVDWTVYSGKLIIGTTKMTARSIIDRLIKEEAELTKDIEELPD